MVAPRNTIRALADNELEVVVYDSIDRWWWTDSNAVGLERVLRENPSAKVIHVRINSPGGDVHETLAMMSQLARHPAEIRTYNDGLAASAASLLMQAGSKRYVSQGADMMVHYPWTVAVGDAEELEKVAQLLRTKGEEMVSLYAQASGQEEKTVREWLAAETWMTAQEQVANGLADEIVPVVAVAASMIEPGRYRNTPARLLATKKPDRQDTSMGSTPQPAKAPDAAAIKAKAKEEERARIASITARGTKLGISAKDIQAAIDSDVDANTFLARAVDESEAKFAPVVQDRGRPATIEAGDDERDKLGASLQAAILLRAGNLSRVQDGLERAKKANLYNGATTFTSSRQHSNMQLRDMARMSLEKAGVATDRMTVKEMVGQALVFRSSSGGANTTADFPNLLEDTLHKVLLAEYMLAMDTWMRWCGQGTVSDFRPHHLYRMGSIGNLEKVNEHGEIKRKSIDDARKESIQTDEYGLIIALTRKAIINDDMSAFSGLPRDIGRAAARTIETAAYALLALNDGLGPLMQDGLPLFDAAHSNISPASALSVAGLDEDRRTFRKQKDESGNDFLDVMPSVLLVPLALGSTALEIIGAEFNTDSGVPNNRTPNRVRNMVRDVVDSPRLDENGTTKAATRRYLFADPAQNPAIQVVRLAGENGPMLEARDGWDVSGREWKVTDDFGVGATDYRTAVTNAGA